MKRINPYLTTPAWLLTTLYVLSAQGQPQPADLELIELRDNLYVIHNPGAPGNATALVTDEGVLLIDDKFEQDYNNIVAMIASVTDQPVTHIVNTHYHADHSGSNVQFQRAGADVVATEMARARMVATNQPGWPKITFEDSARIHLGGVIVDLMYLGRGHTGGDLVVYFPQYQILVAGDLFNLGSTTAQLIDYAGGGSQSEWTNTLDNIMELGFETVVPGHGRVATRADMQSYRDGTVEVRNRVRELLSEGISPEELETVVREDFGWGDLHVTRALYGIMGELR